MPVSVTLSQGSTPGPTLGAGVHSHTVTPPFPNKKYSVIYADPPWAWSKGPLVNRGRARTVEKEYPTMQPDEIQALPVQSLASDNSILFLWATGPKLPEAMAVMDAWGFTYKTIGFNWVKQNPKSGTLFWGLGFYTRANVEVCLIGTRGSPRRKSASVHQVIMAPVSRHSAKPAQARERIEELYDGPYVELFARETAPGWDLWGLEAPAPVASRHRILAHTSS